MAHCGHRDGPVESDEPPAAGPIALADLFLSWIAIGIVVREAERADAA
jgi:hypothetical protein